MVRLITDSTADLEPKEYEKLKIDCIPLKVLFGDREYEENVDLSKEEFYALLAGGEFPKTSQPAPHWLMELFEQAEEAGDEALYLSISSAISGSYQTACAMKEMVDSENCYVVDSKNATGGMRVLLDYAVELRDQGKSAAQIAQALEDVRDKVVLYACMDTLEYLYRGGRISQTAYKLGSMAQVKPIIRVTEEGTIEVPAKAMGMRKGIDFLCKKVEERRPDSRHNLYVMYGGNRTNGDLLAAKLRTMGFEIPEERIVNVGAVIGSHVGPNVCGVVYIAE